MEVAPPEILLDVRQSSEDNSKKRIGYLKQLYALAAMEERYEAGEIGKLNCIDHLIHY